MSEAKKEAIFRKLDKRHEDLLAVKEHNKEAREEQDESKDILAKLLQWTDDVTSKIQNEIDKADTDNAQEILDSLSEEMKKLDSFFAEKSSVLTPFDVRKVQSSVVQIRNNYMELQDVLKPKKKFGFKGNKKKAFQKDAKAASDEIQKSENVQKRSEFGYTLKERSNETIEVEDVNGQDVMFSQLSNCTVIMKSNPVTLHATHLSNCVLKCGPVQTSIYLDHCNDCQLSLACQQLRAHNSYNTKIFLHVTSKGIIEDCKGIQVSPYDMSYEGLNEQFVKLGLDQTINHWDQLDDFNWLASDQASPNWSILK